MRSSRGARRFKESGPNTRADAQQQHASGAAQHIANGIGFTRKPGGSGRRREFRRHVPHPHRHGADRKAFRRTSKINARNHPASK